ncbi:MAG: hypothetical protein KGL39_09010 [Patescibacteria group bacterium]|nr:hypothetical protein [Patescibacteria group bacterium]
MKRSLVLWLLAALVAVPLIAYGDPPVNSASGTLTALGDTVSLYCGSGQSSADVYVSAGTLSGVVTVYTAANIGTSVAPLPGATGAPNYATSTGTSNTLSSFPGHVWVTLGSSPYVYAVLTTATSGSATAYIRCSGAVARGPFVSPAPGSSGYVALYPAAVPSPLQSGYAGISGNFAAGGSVTAAGVVLNTSTGTTAGNISIGGGLQSNTTGNGNTASGLNALYSNATGNNNTASGLNALYSNTTGYSNTASGLNALYSNTTGYSNTASGLNALYSNTTGNNNTVSGVNALHSFTGSDNSALGACPDAACYNFAVTSNQNLELGYDLTLPSTSINGQLDIQNAIYGTLNTGTTTTLSTGCIMLYSTTCASGESLKVNGPVNVVSAKNKGLLSCTPSAATTCATNPTVTVTAGAVCTASYDTTTAATAGTLLPIVVGVSSTTLTLTPRTSTAQSALLAMDYVCL